LGFETEHLEKLAYEVKRYSLKRQIESQLSSESSQKDVLKRLAEALKDVEKKIVSL
jgi:hypothetical protein